MKIKLFLLSTFIIANFCILHAQVSSNISVKINEQTGNYIVNSTVLNWTFSGTVNHKIFNEKNIDGIDMNGHYKAISFSWNDTIVYNAKIKWYADKSVVLFSYTLPNGSANSPAAFPSFTQYPQGFHPFSFFNDNFAAPQFLLNETSTPWLFLMIK